METGFNRTLRRAAMTLAFAGAAATVSADIILHPGYLTGTFTIGDYNVHSVNINASGGGYGASKSVAGASYTLTVEGGDWDYAVGATAYVRPVGAYYPYTYMTFNNRSLQVPAGTTVTNDYAFADAATIRFQVNITGDAYNYWYGYGYAVQNVAPPAEKTYSQSYTHSNYSPLGEWDMPVVPNDNIRIYARVRVDSRWYYFWWYSSDPRYENIGPGETLIVPLNIEHTVVEPPPPPPPPEYDYGKVQTTIDLLLNEPSAFRRHYVYGYGGRYLNENPASYLFDPVRTGTYTYRARTWFDDYRTHLQWPYTGGDYLNDRVTVEPDQTATKDFFSNTGVLTGDFAFTGTLEGTALNRSLYAYGASNFYDPVNGWVRQNTYGGWASQSKLIGDPDTTYRLFLNPGPWLPYRVNASASDASQGYSRSFSLSIYDYNHYYDGRSYDFGAPTYIGAGATTVQDWEYCAGSVVVGFLDETGGTISYPRLNASGSKRTETGKTLLSASAYGSSNAYNILRPEVEIHGPPGDYNLYNIRFRAQDGTNLSFPGFPISLECGVRKGVPISGKPEILVEHPPAYFITNAQTVTVSGTASDDNGIASMTVNDNPVEFQPTGNPDNQVSFAYELPLPDSGTQLIVTSAADVDGNQSFDERPIHVDHWMPTVTISPADGTIFPDPNSTVPVEVVASDQGYGFTLKVYLNDGLIHESDGPGDQAEAKSVTYSDTFGPLDFGEHTIRAVVADAAGNEVSESVTIYYSDPWPPTVNIRAPEEGSLYNGKQAIPVSVQAADRGPGFTLELFADGTSLGSKNGPVNLSAPATVELSRTAGPLEGGEHIIRAVATDKANNTAVDERTVRVDSWMPTVSIASPADGSFHSHVGTIPVEVNASDRGYGFSLTVTLDGVAIGAPVPGPADPSAKRSVSFLGTVGPLAPGAHVIEAVVTDEAGNSASATTTLTVYLLGNAAAKPEARHNKENGTSTIFVQLPNGMTSVGSLATGDSKEISADPDQYPTDAKYSADEDKLIFKFSRTPALMADSYYEMEGKYCPTPAAGEPAECNTWRAHDTTLW